jgi:hypothetical protein
LPDTTRRLTARALWQRQDPIVHDRTDLGQGSSRCAPVREVSFRSSPARSQRQESPPARLRRHVRSNVSCRLLNCWVRFDSHLALNFRQESYVSSGPCRELGVGSMTVDRGFLAPSRANSDECRQRPVPMTTSVRRDRCPKGKCLKARVHTASVKRASTLLAARQVCSQLTWQGTARQSICQRKPLEGFGTIGRSDGPFRYCANAPQ